MKSDSDEEVVARFPWPTSRTANCQCQITIRKGKDGTRNVYKGIYFRPNEMI